MRLRRLPSMKLDEIVGRAAQRLAAWSDLAGSAVQGRGAGADAAVHFSGRGLEALETAACRLFAGAADIGTPDFMRARFPLAPREFDAAAAGLLRQRFDLLGYRGLDFGDPIDWRRDPVSGRRAPLRPSSRLDPADASTCGDCKVIWELNRHQWLVTLAQAYRLTGDERCARHVGHILETWQAANPGGVGINWTSSLEVALRLISWCWAACLLRHSEAAGVLSREAPGLIRCHARRIERFLSRYSAPNTHLTGEALGLFYAGALFPDFPEAERWRAAGRAILTEQIERQVLEDGVYFEQSTCYQRYTAEIYLHFLLLEERLGSRVPPSVPRRLQRLLDFLVAIERPDGSLPAIGDADGGWLLPLRRREPDDARGIFSTAAVLFGRGDYARAAGGLAEETVWLLGPRRAGTFDAIEAVDPAGAPSRLFKDGGYAVLRSGWENHDHCLVFDFGPLGCPPGGGHGHADLLSLQCSAFGEPYVIDPGTYRYAADPLWRDHFRGTAAHATLTVDGADQAATDGPFGWRTLPRARLRDFVSAPSHDLVDAEHVSRRRGERLVHRRRVLFVKPRYWVVADDVEGEREHRIDLRYPLATSSIDDRADGWTRASGARGRGLWIKAFASAPMEKTVLHGSQTPPAGWVSPHYGVKRPAPVLVLSATTRLPLRILTVLAPAANGEAPPRVLPLPAADGRDPAGLLIDGDAVGFAERGVIVRPGGAGRRTPGA